MRVQGLCTAQSSALCSQHVCAHAQASHVPRKSRTSKQRVERHVDSKRMRGKCACELCALTGLGDHSGADSFMPSLRRSVLRIHRTHGCLKKTKNYTGLMKLVCEDIKETQPLAYATFCKHIVVYDIPSVKVYRRTTRNTAYAAVVRRGRTPSPHAP